jgi:hypothetical protein
MAVPSNYSLKLSVDTEAQPHHVLVLPGMPKASFAGGQRTSLGRCRARKQMVAACRAVVIKDGGGTVWRAQ